MPLIDNYLSLLENLSDDMKRDVIASLSRDLSDEKRAERRASKKLAAIYGSFDSPETAEELADKIRAARSFHRHREDL